MAMIGMKFYLLLCLILMAECDGGTDIPFDNITSQIPGYQFLNAVSTFNTNVPEGLQAYIIAPNYAAPSINGYGQPATGTKPSPTPQSTTISSVSISPRTEFSTKGPVSPNGLSPPSALPNGIFTPSTGKVEFSTSIAPDQLPIISPPSFEYAPDAITKITATVFHRKSQKLRNGTRVKTGRIHKNATLKDASGKDYVPISIIENPYGGVSTDANTASTASGSATVSPPSILPPGVSPPGSSTPAPSSSINAPGTLPIGVSTPGSDDNGYGLPSTGSTFSSTEISVSKISSTQSSSTIGSTGSFSTEFQSTVQKTSSTVNASSTGPSAPPITVTVSPPGKLPIGISPPSDYEDGIESTVPPGYGTESGSTEKSISISTTLPPAVSPPGNSEEATIRPLPDQKSIFPTGRPPSNKPRSKMSARKKSTTSGPRLTTPKSKSTNLDPFDILTLPTTKKAKKTTAHASNSTLAKKISKSGSEDSSLESLKLGKTSKSKKVTPKTTKLATPPHTTGRPGQKLATMPPAIPSSFEILANKQILSSRSSQSASTAITKSISKIDTTTKSAPTIAEKQSEAVLSLPKSDFRQSAVTSIGAPAKLPQGVSPPAGNAESTVTIGYGPAPVPGPVGYNVGPAGPSVPGQYGPAQAPGPVGPQPSQYAPAPNPVPAPPGQYQPNTPQNSYASIDANPGKYENTKPGPARPSGYEVPAVDPSSYGPSIDPNCVDVHPKCDYFVANGKCYNPKFSTFVRQVCPRSCSACEVHPYGSRYAGGNPGGYAGPSTGQGQGYGQQGQTSYSGTGSGKPGLGPGDYYFGPPTLPLGPPSGPPGCCDGGGSPSGLIPSSGCGSTGCGGQIGCGAGGCGGSADGQQPYGPSGPGYGQGGGSGTYGSGSMKMLAFS